MRGILTLDVFWSLAERVRRMLIEPLIGPRNVPLITCAASLAHHGLLGSLDDMKLENVDLNTVPAEHLASLASSVKETIDIIKVKGCNLVTILNGVKNLTMLTISFQSLDREETLALVQVMESRVERVILYEEVTLNIMVLNGYNGKGRCRGLRCFHDTAVKYREQLRTWAVNRNWTVLHDILEHFSILG